MSISVPSCESDSKQPIHSSDLSMEEELSSHVESSQHLDAIEEEEEKSIDLQKGAVCGHRITIQQTPVSPFFEIFHVVNAGSVQKNSNNVAIVREIDASFATLTDAILGFHISNQVSKPVPERKEDPTSTSFPIEAENTTTTTASVDNMVLTPSLSVSPTSRKPSSSNVPIRPSPSSEHKASQEIESARKSRKKAKLIATVQPFDYTAALETKHKKISDSPQPTVSFKLDEKHRSLKKKSRNTSHLSRKLCSGSRSISFKP